MKEKILAIINDKRLETWAWESINALLVIAIAMLTDVSVWWAIPIIAVLNQLTKFINITYLKK